MASNTIVERVFDFLKGFPPFNMLETEQLRLIAKHVEVKYIENDQYVFRQGDQAGAFFYVVKDGSVELLKEQLGSVDLLDICDEGDVFGVRAMISQKSYVSTAKTREESLLYAIPVEVFRPLLDANNRVALYFAAGFASGQAIVRNPLETIEKGRKDLNHAERQLDFFRMDDTFSIEGSRDLIAVSPEHSIRDTAKLMQQHRIGSMIIVDKVGRPIGIITDTDFRNKVATGAFSIDTPIGEIMNSPVLTIAPNRSVAEVMIEMMRAQIHHLCVTTDGSDETKAIGVISYHDLLLSQSDNPAVIVREIQKSHGTARLPELRDRAEVLLRNYLEQDVAVTFVTEVITEINDAITIKAIRQAEEDLAAEGMASPQLQYAWMSLGSEGRMEQLLRTDQDNAFVYENPEPEKAEQAHAYFLALTSRVTQVLMDCGFVKCPADMMASNPKWCQPISQWKKYFSNWIHSPDTKAVMYGTIFFDFRFVYGEHELTKALTEYIYQEIGQSKMFLNFFAKNATQNPPPLGFFRNFIVERGGNRKDDFDIKARAMMPLADAARLLTMDQKLPDSHNTILRFEKLAQASPQHAGLYKEAAMAYEILLRFRVLSGLEHHDSGRYIHPEKLNKIERQILRNAFKPIEELQVLLRSKFRLDFFN